MQQIKIHLILAVLASILSSVISCSSNAEATNASTAIGVFTNTENTVRLDSSATVIYHDSAGNVWLVSHEKGVYRYNGAVLTLFTATDGLGSYRILNVQEDDAGNLYFDTPMAVYKWNGKAFSDLPIATDSQDEWKSEPGDLWFRMGWDNKGPYRFDGEKLVQLHFPTCRMEDAFYEQSPNAAFNPYSIYSMYKDRKGNLWFGTSNMGVYLFDGKEISWMFENHLMETPAGGNFGVRSIAEDNEGNFWISNANYKYTLLPSRRADVNGLKEINYKRQNGIESNTKSDLYFYSIDIDRNGNLLMFAKDDGLWSNNGETLSPFNIEAGKKNISPTSVFKDSQGLFWIGTLADGIFKYDGNSFEKFEVH